MFLFIHGTTISLTKIIDIFINLLFICLLGVIIVISDILANKNIIKTLRLLVNII